MGLTKRNLTKINKLISPLCEQECPDQKKERCCDKIFCSEVDRYLAKIGKVYLKPNYLGVPYLSKKGCVVPYDERPICTCFACEHVLKDKKVLKRWEHLQKTVRLEYDEEVKGVGSSIGELTYLQRCMLIELGKHKGKEV